MTSAYQKKDKIYVNGLFWKKCPFKEKNIYNIKMKKELEEKIYEVLRTKKGIKDNSIAIYISNLNSMNKLLERAENFKTLSFLRNAKLLITLMKTKEINTQLRWLSTIMGLIRVWPQSLGLGNAYNNHFIKLKELQRESEDKQELNGKEQKMWLTDADIKFVNDTLLHAKDPNDFIIWNLFTLIAPRRAIDYSSMKITSKPKRDDTNYLVRGSDGFTQFIFNNYKNSGTKGQAIFTREWILDTFGDNGKKMITILDLFLRSKKNGEYLLRKLSGNSFSKYFTRIGQKILKRRININILRHKFITDFLSRAPFEDEKKKVSEFMGNSVEVQAMYRRKNEAKKEKKVLNENKDAIEN